MELDTLIRDRVRRPNGCRPGVVVVELPRGHRAVALRSGPNRDYAGGTEIGPRELFFAGPDHLHRFPGSACEARRLDRRVARMLPSVRRPGVGHADPHTIERNVKRIDE